MNEARKEDDALTFSVEVLFSEPLEFTLAEIAQAVAEDHPDCMVTVPDYIPAGPINTDHVVLGALSPVDPANGGTITITGMGRPDEGFRAADHTELAWRSGPAFAQQALDAIKAHQSYVSFSIKATDRSLAGRFRAARQLNAVTAVFAQLPIALGVIVHWSRHMVAPNAWCKAARDASTGDWPLTAWIAYRAGWDNARDAPNQMAVGFTSGLAHFLDLEFQVEPAPILPTDALSILHGACWLPLQGGSACRDGDTMGVEGAGLKYTMRRRKNDDGSFAPVMSLLHPDSPVDEDTTFGPNPLMKPPDGYDNTNPLKPGFMKGLLRRQKTVH